GLLLLGVPLCAAGQRWYGRKDPGQVIWDEIASMPLVYFAIPKTQMADSGVLLVGFALHRFFDISKPPPCRQLERLPSGWGIMADDVMAAFYAAIVLRALLWLGWIG
ncbi:MAG: phosphatidylglycerophosphatase A, partial [Planctomycetales bacterium]|nr:phosphatidylglycerophosphatase A [Planctomycetales bacterium]